MLFFCYSLINDNIVLLLPKKKKDSVSRCFILDRGFRLLQHSNFQARKVPSRIRYHCWRQSNITTSTILK